MIAERMKQAIGRIVTCALAPLIALVLAIPAAAAEGTDDDLNFYVQYNAGATWVPNQSLTAADASGTNKVTGQRMSGHTEQNIGFAVGGAIGTRFLDFFRGELEYMYRQSEVTNFSVQGGNSDASGDVSLMTVMLNGYFEYDLDIGFVPYVGLGIGWGMVKLDAKNRELPESAKPESKDAVFAYSLMAGGSIPINEVLDIQIGYRYIRTTESRIDTGFTDKSNPPPALIETRSRRFDYEYDAHEGIVGLRLNF